MRTVNIHAAKTQLSRLVDAAVAGEEIIIARSGKPVARLGPLAGPRQQRRLGILAGKLRVPEDFDASLPDELADSFEGRRCACCSTPMCCYGHEPHRLDADTRATIKSGETDVLFRAASIWQIAVKAPLGRPDFAFDPAEIARSALDTGFAELPIRANAAAFVGRLPGLHRDLFDRVLVAQAIVEPATLYTADRQLMPY